jgi:hypothetical protein
LEKNICQEEELTNIGGFSRDNFFLKCQKKKLLIQTLDLCLSASFLQTHRKNLPLEEDPGTQSHKLVLQATAWGPGTCSHTFPCLFVAVLVPFHFLSGRMETPWFPFTLVLSTLKTAKGQGDFKIFQTFKSNLFI